MKKITKLVSVALIGLAISSSFVSCKSKEEKCAELIEKAGKALAEGDMKAYAKYMEKAGKLIDPSELENLNLDENLSDLQDSVEDLNKSIDDTIDSLEDLDF